MSDNVGVIEARIKFFNDGHFPLKYGMMSDMFLFHNFHKVFEHEGEKRSFLVGGKYYYGNDKGHYPPEERDCLIELTNGEVIKNFLLVGDFFDICIPYHNDTGMRKIGEGIILDIS